MIVHWNTIGSEKATEPQREMITRLYFLLDWKLPLRFKTLTVTEASEYIRAGQDACQHALVKHMEREQDDWFFET